MKILSFLKSRKEQCILLSIFACSLFVSVFGVCCNSFAADDYWSCLNERGNSNLQPVRYVCEQEFIYDNDSNWGIVWVNSCGGGACAYDDTVTVEDSGASTATVYVWGQILRMTWAYLGDAEHTFSVSNRTNFCVSSLSSRSCPNVSAEDASYSAIDLLNNGNEFWVSRYSDPNSGINQWTGASTPTAVSLNIDKIKREVRPYRDGGYDVYEYNFHMFYCYEGNDPSGCKTTDAKIKLKLKAENYKTTPTAKINSGDVVYAGETANASFNIKVSALDGNSSGTNISNPTVRMIYFIANSNAGKDIISGWTGDRAPCSGFLNRRGVTSCGSLGGDNHNTLKQGDDNAFSYDNFSIPDGDDSVGKKYCVAIGVKPADSGSHKDEWRVSDASCRTIAKRPSVVVKDGSVFSNGAISTSISLKTSGYFGSWVEYLTVANASVSKFSSGAVLNTNHGTLGCSLFPLTISNDKCSSENTGLGSAEIKPSSAFINWFKNLSLTKQAAEVENGKCLESNGLKICKTDSITANTTSSSDDISSMLVYYNPKGDIKISPSVTELDAWIIAPEGEIKTCDIDHNPNSTECANQLTINGVVYAKNLVLNRTAGVADTAAEIIDLNPITYVWASNYFKTNGSGEVINTIRDVYTRELSPRL